MLVRQADMVVEFRASVREIEPTRGTQLWLKGTYVWVWQEGMAGYGNLVPLGSSGTIEGLWYSLKAFVGRVGIHTRGGRGYT